MRQAGITVGTSPATNGHEERPVLPAGGVRRATRLAALPLRHAARTAAAATRLSWTADQVAARTAMQLFGTLGELKGGAAKLGQAMSVFEAAMPEEVAAPYRTALRRLTDAVPPMPAEAARRVIMSDLGAAFGPGWRERLVDFDDLPVAAASIGQVHRARWRDDRGRIAEVAVKVQYPGVGQALRSDLWQARLLARVMARLTGLNVSGLADEFAMRIVEELDYVREGRIQREVAAAFTSRVPQPLAEAHAAGVREPEGRTRITVPAVYAATPRVLITGWLDGVSLSTLLDGRMDLLPAGWSELSPGEAADVAARLLGHAIYAPAACTGWMHADPHPGNFLLLGDGRVAFVDFGMAKTVSRATIEAELGVLRAGLDRDASSVHAGLAALGFFDPGDPRIDPARLLAHVRALNAWYVDDEPVTLTPQYVSRVMLDAGDPRSEYWDLMRNETIPADSLLSNRMQGMTLAVIGQLRATANWHRVMSEWLYGSPPSSPLGEAEAEFFGLPSAPVRKAA